MQKLICILFVALQLLTNTELCQLAKVPVFMSHFREHKAENNDLTLVAFFQLHYFNGSPHDNTDMELPFKTPLSALLFHNSPSAPVPSMTAITDVPMQEIQINFNEYSHAYIAFVCHSDIFQPPQVS